MLRCLPCPFPAFVACKVVLAVCVSVCTEGPSHPLGCGFGCATSVRNCFDTIMSQVTVVVDSVGKVAVYATGQVAIYEVVSELLQITEFIISSLWPMFQIVKEVWKLWDEAQSVAGFDSKALVQSDDCDKVYNGQCCGACPAHYPPSLLAKWFSPVCVSVCTEDPSHPVGCGIGCATSVWSDVDAICHRCDAICHR